jgi:hypothetical protein
VGEAAAEPRLLRVLIVVVERMIVAGRTGEEQKVGIADRAGRSREAVADREIVQVELSIVGNGFPPSAVKDLTDPRRPRQGGRGRRLLHRRPATYNRPA